MNGFVFDKGIDITPVQSPMGFTYGAGVFGPEVEIRRLEDIRASLRDPQCKGPEQVYSIAMDVGKEEHRVLLNKLHLLFGGYAPVDKTSVMYKGKCGEDRREHPLYFLPGKLACVFFQVLSQVHSLDVAENNISCVILAEHINRRIYVVKSPHFCKHLVKLNKFGHKGFILGNAVLLNRNYRAVIISAAKCIGHIFPDCDL